MRACFNKISPKLSPWLGISPGWITCACLCFLKPTASGQLIGLSTDGDRDGIPTSWENRYSLNDNDPTDAKKDPDGDGLNNRAEFLAGSSPYSADTDADTLDDGMEVNFFLLDPTNRDSDGDGISDPEEIFGESWKSASAPFISGSSSTAPSSSQTSTLSDVDALLDALMNRPDHEGYAVCGAHEGTASGRGAGEAFQIALLEANLIVNTDRSFKADGSPTLDPIRDAGGEEAWRAERGAIYLVNQDEDEKLRGKDGEPLSDALERRYGGDRVTENWEIENSKDALELAPIEVAPIPDLPNGSDVTLRLTGESAADDFQAFHLYIVDETKEERQYIPVWGGYTTEIPETVTRWSDAQISRWVSPDCPGYRETRIDHDGDGRVSDENYRFALEGTLAAGEKKLSGKAFGGVLEIALELRLGNLVVEADRIRLTQPGHTKLRSAKKAAPADVTAFPGAEGFGKWSRGGRYGQVIYVTNTKDYDPLSEDSVIPGSLRYAVEQEYPRIILFALPEDTDGTITLKSELTIRHPFITIAGQTARGGGITLRRYGLTSRADHVVIRHIRSRPGDEAGSRLVDGFNIMGGDNVILDHCSASWSMDEALSVTNAGRVTIQWCLIAEALNVNAHGYGSLLRGDSVNNGSQYSLHHNVWAHHRRRMPRIGNYLSPNQDPKGGLFDIRYNTFFNWGETYSSHNFDTGGNESSGISRYNFVGNDYIPGKNSDNTTFFYERSPRSSGHFSANRLDGTEVDQSDHLLYEPVGGEATDHKPFRSSPHSAPHLPELFDGDELSDLLFSEAGASLARDAVDKRIATRKGKIINSQSEVGGWPKIPAEKSSPDSDGDGLPDLWEELSGLNSLDPKDGQLDPDKNGHTHLDDYLAAVAAGEWP